MAEQSRFRGALNGFNRTDVVNYIESMSAEQQKQLRKLQEEKQALTEQNAALEEKLAAANAQLFTLREQDASLEEQVTLLSEQAAELAERARQAEERAEAAEATAGEAALDSEDAPEEDAADDYAARELEAYRRAEQTERNAAMRAGKVYQQLRSLCERAQGRYNDAGEEIGALTEDLTANLSRLQQTLAELNLAFEEAEDAFGDLDLPQMD